MQMEEIEANLERNATKRELGRGDEARKKWPGTSFTSKRNIKTEKRILSTKNTPNWKKIKRLHLN